MGGVRGGSDAFFSVSPAVPGEAGCFAVRVGSVKNARADVDAHHPEFARLRERIRALPHTALVSEIIASPLISGFAAGKANRAQAGEDSIPQIRPTQVLPDGEIDLSNAYGIRVQDIRDRDYLQIGEVLFNNTNSTALVGKTAVFLADIPAVCSNHITRLRLRDGVQAEFVALTMNMLRERGYFAWLCTNFNNQAGINTNTLVQVRIPLPPYAERARLVAEMDAARAERRGKLAEADTLLAGIDDYLLDTLGIAPPAADTRRVFAVSLQAVINRIDPHFHSPEFARIERMLSQTHCEPLGSIATFSNETWSPQDHDQPAFRYIEISAVSPQTGQADWNEVPTAKAPSRARMQVWAGDIIVSLTRPHHGSIAHLGTEFDGCVASTGFAVIRDVAEHISRAYLWCALRAQFCLQQMRQRSSGGNYPAITEAELAKILIPVPDWATQQRIAAEVNRRRDDARRLRAEGQAGWQTAKGWFEAQVL